MKVTVICIFLRRIGSSKRPSQYRSSFSSIYHRGWQASSPLSLPSSSFFTFIHCVLCPGHCGRHVTQISTAWSCPHRPYSLRVCSKWGGAGGRGERCVNSPGRGADSPPAQQEGDSTVFAEERSRHRMLRLQCRDTRLRGIAYSLA